LTFWDIIWYNAVRLAGSITTVALISEKVRIGCSSARHCFLVGFNKTLQVQKNSVVAKIISDYAIFIIYTILINFIKFLGFHYTFTTHIFAVEDVVLRLAC